MGLGRGGCAGAQVGRHQVPRWQRLEEALVEQLLSSAHSSRVARTACAVVSTAGGAFSCRVYAVSKAHLTVVRTLASCTAQRVHARHACVSAECAVELIEIGPTSGE